MKALMVAAGAVLAASPLILAFIGAALDEGVLFTCAIFVVVAVLAAVVFAGIWLLTEGLNR